MILERLEEAKENRDINHEILYTKMNKCNDGIQSISTALVSSNTEEKEQNKMLRNIQKNTNFLCRHIQRTCKEK